MSKQLISNYFGFRKMELYYMFFRVILIYKINIQNIQNNISVISLYNNNRGGRMNAKQLESSIRGNVR